MIRSEGLLRVSATRSRSSPEATSSGCRTNRRQGSTRAWPGHCVGVLGGSSRSSWTRSRCPRRPSAPASSSRYSAASPECQPTFSRTRTSRTPIQPSSPASWCTGALHSRWPPATHSDPAAAASARPCARWRRADARSPRKASTLARSTVASPSSPATPACRASSRASRRPSSPRHEVPGPGVGHPDPDERRGPFLGGEGPRQKRRRREPAHGLGPGERESRPEDEGEQQAVAERRLRHGGGDDLLQQVRAAAFGEARGDQADDEQEQVPHLPDGAGQAGPSGLVHRPELRGTGDSVRQHELRGDGTRPAGLGEGTGLRHGRRVALPSLRSACFHG